MVLIKKNGKSKIKNLIATIKKNIKTNKMEPTYKIIEGEPLGKSFANEVIEDYGISFNQLNNLLYKRGIIKE